MVLPLISGMLMEEDIDDKFFCEYPDHPALLQVQQPFLDILSDDTASSSSPSATHSVTNVTHPAASSSSSDVTANAPLTPAAVGSYTSNPDAHFNGFNLDPAAFFSVGANSNLMSSAFLKGVEEANKFLPGQNKLVIDLDPPEDAKKWFVLPAKNKFVGRSFFVSSPTGSNSPPQSSPHRSRTDRGPGRGAAEKGTAAGRAGVRRRRRRPPWPWAGRAEEVGRQEGRGSEWVPQIGVDERFPL
jgi:hypothetical protein